MGPTKHKTFIHYELSLPYRESSNLSTVFFRLSFLTFVIPLKTNKSYIRTSTLVFPFNFDKRKRNLKMAEFFSPHVYFSFDSRSEIGVHPCCLCTPNVVLCHPPFLGLNSCDPSLRSWMKYWRPPVLETLGTKEAHTLSLKIIWRYDLNY